MKNNFSRLCLIAGVAVALAVGFAIGRVSQPKGVAERPAEKAYAAKHKIADFGADAAAATLRARVAQLERELAQRAAESARAPTNGLARGMGRPDPRRFLEDLKEKDPARYAQITNRMAQGRLRRAAQAQNRMEFLASIDTSRWSAGAKKVHAQLQEMLAAREEIERQLHDPDLSDSDRKALFEEMHKMRGRMNDLNRQERSNLLDATARELGFSGSEAKEITATIQDVIKATGGERGHGPQGGMPPPPDGGGRGAPGGP